MDIIELDKLETNINQVIEIIQKLHSENQQLKQQNEQLLTTINEQEAIIQQLRNQDKNDVARENQIDFSKEKEAKIKLKIQQMLEKVDIFQQLTMK